MIGRCNGDVEAGGVVDTGSNMSVIELWQSCSELEANWSSSIIRLSIPSKIGSLKAMIYADI